MYDKKKSSNNEAFSPSSTAFDCHDRHLIEQNLINALMTLNHKNVSLVSLSKQTLSLLLLHPLFNECSATIWQKKDKSIHILAKHALDSKLEKELESISTPPVDENISIQIQWDLEKNNSNSPYRIDIFDFSFETEVNTISLWLDISESKVKSVYSFLENYFGIFNLLSNKIALEKQAKLYKSIIEKTTDAIEIMDNNAIIHYVNPAFEKITQFSSKEALGQPAARLLHAKDASPVFFNDIQQQLDAGKIWEGEIRSRKKDNDLWISHAVIIPFFDEEAGKITHHIAIKKDITEHINKLNKLAMSEENYKNIMNAASDAIFVNDINGVVIDVNDAACLSLGYTHEEMRHSKVWDFEVGISIEQMNAMWDDLPYEPITLDGMHRRKDGTTFPVEVRIGVYITNSQKLIIAIARDISERKTVENRIKHLASAIEQSPVLVLITDKSGLIEYTSNKLTSLTGYKPEDIIGKNASIFKSEMTDRQLFVDLWDTLTSGCEWRGEILNKNKHGELFWVSSIISPLKNDSGSISHYLSIMVDITQQKIYDEILKHQATFDTMTNLPNRLSGQTRLEKSISDAKTINSKVALLYLDLDEFKAINDSLGHAMGDLLLQSLSSRLFFSIRRNDTIARMGGDEFMIILDDIQHMQDAFLIAEKCIKACNEPFMIQSHTLKITVSIGIALFPEHGKDAKQLMHHADIAMYQAKTLGKNQWQVYSGPSLDDPHHYELTKKGKSLPFNKKEFNLLFQPIIDVKQNTVVGAEALLKWTNSLSQTYAGNIIPIVREDTVENMQSVEWIIEEACHKASHWQKARQRTLKIAVGISLEQLKNPMLLQVIQSALRNTNLPPEHLILELTESILVDHSPIIFNHLKELAKMKVECTINDFCMGYSSLEFLHSYPFKSIKINENYIKDIHVNLNDLNLVKNIISLSKKLKLKVIAEGIKNLEQLELMRLLQCDYVQGPYFSKALNEQQFLDFLLTRE